MNRDKKKLDNRGVSILLVIVTMSIVAILATVIIAITYRNLEKIQNSVNSTVNFYSAEAAMDELKSNFMEWSDDAMRESYTTWLQKYTSTAMDDQETVFKQLFVAKLKLILEAEFIDAYFGASPANIEDLFVTYDASRVAWNSGVTPFVNIIDDNKVLIVKNISLVYNDVKGYETKITTDFRFDLNYPGFSANIMSNTNERCTEYVIIADEQINNMASSVVHVDGSLYGGGYNPLTDRYDKQGIIFDGGQLNIYAKHLLSKKDIEFTNGAKLNAKGLDARYDYTGDISYVDIWAEGLCVTGVGESTMNIQGNCYVYDDTSVNAEGSKFSVNGAYYGYNTNNATGSILSGSEELRMGTPEGSSALIVNAKNTLVDLTACNPVWLAGKAFVSVPTVYGISSVLDTNVSFPEGESISYRALQSAYLLPGDCITGIGHNPMTEAEYNKLISGDAAYYIDIDRSRKNGGVSLANYLQIDKPYRVATVNYSVGASSDKIVYLYLNFISSDKASTYFQEYSAKYGDMVDNKLSMIGTGNILFDPSNLVTTGNVLGYNSTNNTATIKENTDTYNSDRIENKETVLNMKYSGLITALDEDYTGIGVSQFLSDNFVNMSMVTNTTPVIQELDYTGLAGFKYKFITGKDITISENMAGIVLATGNVTVANGVNFRGMIIARGVVQVQGGNLTAEPEEVSELITNNSIVAPYFKIGGDGSSGSSTGNILSSELLNIKYENWSKN